MTRTLAEQLCQWFDGLTSDGLQALMATQADPAGWWQHTAALWREVWTAAGREPPCSA